MVQKITKMPGGAIIRNAIQGLEKLGTVEKSREKRTYVDFKTRNAKT